MGSILIRDPVHGDIALSAEEMRILDSRVMQRLRHIKQLGTAHLVYPGCTHTRFDHSLGTVATTQRILNSLSKSGQRVTADDARLIRIAALLHDVSHIPFGHTFEDERKVFSRHDTPERLTRFLAGGELGEILASLGLRDDVLELLTDPRDWRGQIVVGTLDADLLDYLRRDSYFAGLSQDYDDRIYSYFCVEGGQLAVDLTKRGLERHDARSEIVHLLRMRYFLTERVYFHHAKVIAGAMVSKALELSTGLGVGEADLYDKGDETLIDFLLQVGEAEEKDRSDKPDSGRPEYAVQALVNGVRRRRLLKRAYVTTYAGVTPGEQERLVQTYHRSAADRLKLERRIARAADLPAHEIVVYAPAKTALKEASMLARTPDGIRRLNESPNRHLELDALEEQYARIWRFWVFGPKGREDAVGGAAEQALGIPNELGRRQG